MENYANRFGAEPQPLEPRISQASLLDRCLGWFGEIVLDLLLFIVGEGNRKKSIVRHFDDPDISFS